MGPTLFADSNFDFVGKRFFFLALSGILMTATVVSLLTRGLNLGVEFTGGASLEVNFDESKTTKEPVTIGSVRAALNDAGLSNATVTTLGAEEEHDYLIRVQSLGEATENLGANLRDLFVSKYGEDKVTYFTFDEETRDSASVRIEDDAVTAADVKALLAGAQTLGGLRVDDVRGDPGSGVFSIRFENAAQDVLQAFNDRFGADTYEASVDAIGAAVSQDLRQKGLLALIAACVLIACYIWLRFEIEFAPGAIVALIHDAAFVVGVWSITQWEFNLTILAALLAIIGYSVNDTVVIYDRVRENLGNHEGKPLLWVINKSVNETLSRTILTSLLTMFSVIAIAVFGSESIRWFGVAMVVGLISGTYSTLYIATPITIWVYELRDRQRSAAASQEATAR